jgi:hypothetical protein
MAEAYPRSTRAALRRNTKPVTAIAPPPTRSTHSKTCGTDREAISDADEEKGTACGEQHLHATPAGIGLEIGDAAVELGHADPTRDAGAVFSSPWTCRRSGP